MPAFLNPLIANIRRTINNKLAEINTESAEELSNNRVATILSMIKSADPIVYVEDGNWTVIIDQYADFPQEQQILLHVKDHYSRLGRQFGVLHDN